MGLDRAFCLRRVAPKFLGLERDWRKKGLIANKDLGLHGGTSEKICSLWSSKSNSDVLQLP